MLTAQDLSESNQEDQPDQWRWRDGQAIWVYTVEEGERSTYCAFVYRHVFSKFSTDSGARVRSEWKPYKNTKGYSVGPFVLTLYIRKQFRHHIFITKLWNNTHYEENNTTKTQQYVTKTLKLVSWSKTKKYKWVHVIIGDFSVFNALLRLEVDHGALCPWCHYAYSITCMYMF